jgi:hypothetical protein
MCVHRSNIDKLQAEIDVDVQQKRVGVEQMIDSDETSWPLEQERRHYSIKAHQPVALL